MGDKYNNSNFKRNVTQDPNQEHDPQNGEDGLKLNEKAGEYMRELLSEKIKLNTAKFPISTSLIEQEVAKVQASGRVPHRDSKFVDIHRDKPIKVVVKVLVPTKEFPKFNFVGKILGPKGNTMKQLQEETMCKMAVLGRGSMRDRQKEEELRNSLDPKYAHLMDDLHVEISALASPTEAHARIAYALAEVKKYLTPDPAEMMWQTPPRHEIDRDGHAGRRPLLANPQPSPESALYSACTVTKRSLSYHNPGFNNVVNQGVRGGHPPRPMPRGLPTTMPHAPHRPMQAKTKVISILDRARSALESSYPYEDPYVVAHEPPPIRGTGRGVAEPDPYYERAPAQHDRFYEDEPYEFKPDYKSVRDVGSRRATGAPQQRHYARASPYGRPPKYVNRSNHSQH